MAHNGQVVKLSRAFPEGSQPRPCRVCGTPTTARFGICAATSACKSAWQKAYRDETARQEGRVCSVCGGPLNSRITTGICRSNPECKRRSEQVKHHRQYLKNNPDIVRY